jgi:uncharacterized alpha/beta hydrolase family protein
MTAKKKGKSPIEKIIVGIIIIVASSLIIAWYSGAFNSTTNQNAASDGNRPGATKVR